MALENKYQKAKQVLSSWKQIHEVTGKQLVDRDKTWTGYTHKMRESLLRQYIELVKMQPERLEDDKESIRCLLLPPRLLRKDPVKDKELNRLLITYVFLVHTINARKSS